MFYTKARLKGIVSFDIETVAATKSLDDLTPEAKELWSFRYHEKYSEVAKVEQARNIASGREMGIDIKDPNDIYLKYAPFLVEFSKVLAISFGKFDENFNMDFEELVNENEKDLLTQAALVFNSLKSEPAGFNINTYDIPFLVKRFIINGIPIPDSINFFGKKPWEINSLDLALDWKGGNRDIVALETLSYALGIKTSKDTGVNGANLSKKYHSGECTLDEIKAYVHEDNRANMEIMLKLSK